jgi:hypothetical protein
MLHLSTQDVVLSIEKSPLMIVHGTMYQEYRDFFGKGFSLPALGKKKFTNLEHQELKPRRRLDYNDELMKKIKILFMNTNITGALENKFNTRLTFDSADIWIDDSGYKLVPHTDDSRIKLALQIYLSDNNEGTSLYDNTGNIRYTFPFKFNSGYALYNGMYSTHGVEEIENDGRTSLYVRYQ